MQNTIEGYMLSQTHMLMQIFIMNIKNDGIEPGTVHRETNLLDLYRTYEIYSYNYLSQLYFLFLFPNSSYFSI
jgi:hypothetical protein